MAKKKSWFYRSYFGFVKHRFTEFRDYVFEIENKFSRDLKSIEERYHNDIKRMGEDDNLPHDLVDYYADEVYVVDKMFLRTFRYSAAVTIYTLLDTSMNSLCRMMKKMNKLSIDLDDLRGDGIERSKVYLAKICEIDFPEKSHEWAEIQKLNKIRNCIVHADGEIERAHSPSKIKNIVRNTKGIKVESERYLVIEKIYLDSIITVVEDFLQDIHEKSFYQK